MSTQKNTTASAKSTQKNTPKPRDFGITKVWKAVTNLNELQKKRTSKNKDKYIQYFVDYAKYLEKEYKLDKPQVIKHLLSLKSQAVSKSIVSYRDVGKSLWNDDVRLKKRNLFTQDAKDLLYLGGLGAAALGAATLGTIGLEYFTRRNNGKHVSSDTNQKVQRNKQKCRRQPNNSIVGDEVKLNACEIHKLIQEEMD